MMNHLTSLSSAHHKNLQVATSAPAVSPGRRINMRGQCVDQLPKSHQLFEKGVITKEQYKDFQASILSDVKNFLKIVDNDGTQYTVVI